jgi:hypothetical protein
MRAAAIRSAQPGVECSLTALGKCPLKAVTALQVGE